MSKTQAPDPARAVIEQCRDALAEELGAWDIDPPLHHVKTAHDACVAWLAQAANPAPEGALREAAQRAAEALEKIARHFGIRRLGEMTLADSNARCEAHAAMEALRAALAAPAPQAPAWQPIETAPRDGRRVLVWVADRNFTGCAFAKLWFYSTDGRLGGGAEGFNGDWNITHWMPLPAPPQTKEPTNDR